MKAKILLSVLLSFSFYFLSSQVPQGFNYQAIPRNSSGAAYPDQLIGGRFSIIAGSPEGTAVYVETFSSTTTSLGILNLQIGNGNPVSGSFSSIEWGNNSYYLKVEIDCEGGTSYVDMGTIQLLSVPYALHAQTAAIAQSISGSVAGNIQPPTAVTLPASNISPTSADLNGSVNGKGFLTDVIFQWGLSTAYGNSAAISTGYITGSEDVNVSATLSGLQSATVYHYRIKASNAVNITYSEDMIFTTQMVITAPITSITPNSAVSGGTVVHDGGSTVTARGVCWSTEPDPTVGNSHTSDGGGTGSYTSNMTGLASSTVYYVRAYATNSSGTYYGDNRIFKTYYNTVSDYEGNTYGTVLIGTQEWMAENLKTTHYRNGTAIGYPGSDNDAWKNNTEGAYAWYENDISWKDNYGALYNWYAVTSANNLCPTGWHIPANTEWTVLTDYLGGLSAAGGKLKSTATYPDPHPRWWSPNINATNESGFYGLPGGERDGNGNYTMMGGTAYFWSSTQYLTGIAWLRALPQLNGNAIGATASFATGFSVRCIKDQ